MKTINTILTILLFSISSSLIAQETIKVPNGVETFYSQSSSSASTLRNRNLTFVISADVFKYKTRDKADLLEYNILKQTDRYIIALNKSLDYGYIFYDRVEKELYSISYDINEYEVRSCGKHGAKMRSYTEQIMKKINLGFTTKEVIQVLIDDVEKEF